MTTQVATESRPGARRSEIKISQLPLRQHGLTHVPAVPLDILGMVDTLLRLDGKLKQREQALQGLSRTFTIDGTTAPAYSFLFGTEPVGASAAAVLERLRALLKRNPLGLLSTIVDRPTGQEKELARAAEPERNALTTRFLEAPKQWSIGWTTLPDAHSLGKPHLDEWAATVDVTQSDKATEAFFPMIARYGRGYNLIL